MPLDPTYGVYYETQVGGLCRMHVLNAFFGNHKISHEAFLEYAKAYDSFMAEKFGVHFSSLNYDVVGSDQTNIISYILKRHGICSRYYAPNSLYGATDIEVNVLREAPFVFVYNAGHIWGVIKKGGTHYRVDSMDGVSIYQFQDVTKTSNIGFIVPVAPEQEWNRQLFIIDRILDVNNIKTRNHLREYLLKLHNNKKILGELEVPLGVACSILEMKLALHSSVMQHSFEKVGNLVKCYNAFTSILSDGQYNDVELIMSTVPDLIFNLTKLRRV